MRDSEVKTPRCPVHVGEQMVLHKRRVPLYVAEILPEKRSGKRQWAPRFVEGSFFKCPIQSCTRVERVPNEFENAA